MQKLNDTAHRVLDVAEYYTQTRGFNAFSYKDIQNEVGVKTSSIHYYFPTKQDLAFNMIERYMERFQGLLKNIAQTNKSGLKQLRTLASIYVDIVKQGKFCICGMIASEISTMPDFVNRKLNDFFYMTEKWVADAIEFGKEQGDFKSSVNAKSAASHFLAMLEGGMLIARAQKRPEYLEAIIMDGLDQLKN